MAVRSFVRAFVGEVQLRHNVSDHVPVFEDAPVSEECESPGLRVVYHPPTWGFLIFHLHWRSAVSGASSGRQLRCGTWPSPCGWTFRSAVYSFGTATPIRRSEWQRMVSRQPCGFQRLARAAWQSFVLERSRLVVNCSANSGEARRNATNGERTRRDHRF